MGKPAMMDDAELLRRYAESHSEEAFAELVRRRIGFVYSVALRHTHDAHRAEDVAQAVFTALARKANTLARRPVLIGWLYRSTRFAASDAVRVESRRQAREQEAHRMEHNAAHDPDWKQLRLVIDDVLNELDDRDRDVVLLRFFDELPFAEIGAKLSLTENAARMRAERALEKMHATLARRGVTSTGAALGLALANQAGAAAPAGLAASVTGAAMAGASVGSRFAAIFMNMTKQQIGILIVVFLAGVTSFTLRARDNAELTAQIAALRGQNQAIAGLREENIRLARTASEIEMLRRDDAELARLSAEAAALKKRLADKSANVRQTSAAQPRGNVDMVNVIRIPGGNVEDGLKLYELLAGVRIGRDPGLSKVRRALYFKMESPHSKDEAMALVRTALREQLNVVLETTADGTLVAKPASN